MVELRRLALSGKPYCYRFPFATMRACEIPHDVHMNLNVRMIGKYGGITNQVPRIRV